MCLPISHHFDFSSLQPTQRIEDISEEDNKSMTSENQIDVIFFSSDYDLKHKSFKPIMNPRRLQSQKQILTQITGDLTLDTSFPHVNCNTLEAIDIESLITHKFVDSIDFLPQEFMDSIFEGQQSS